METRKICDTEVKQQNFQNGNCQNQNMETFPPRQSEKCQRVANREESIFPLLRAQAMLNKHPLLNQPL